MRNSLRISRLKELHGLMANHKAIFKPLKFDIKQWSNIESPGDIECGTAACALGSACLHEPFMEQGLRLKMTNCNVRGIHLEPIFQDSDAYQAGAKFFGITIEESVELFHPGSYLKPNSKVSACDVADKVCSLIKNYNDKAEKQKRRKK